MSKSNTLKSSVMFAIIAVLLIAVTVTAYAATNGNDNGYDAAENNYAHDFQLQSGAVVAVYQADENDSLAEIINEITSGTHEIPLPQGNYTILILVPPYGNDAVADTIVATTAMDIPPTASTPEPPAQQPMSATTPRTDAATMLSETTQPQNNVEITTRAELSGNPLHGASFTVYQVADNQRVGEVTTDENGKATISLAQGEYYMRNDSVQYGFLLEQSRIFFTVEASGKVSVEVTIQRDASMTDIEDGSVTVPKTGETPPVMNYVLGTLSFVVAVLCGIGLLNHRKRYSHKRKGALAYA